MNLNWKSTLSAIAPTLGKALLGPLAGSAISILATAIFGEDSSKKESDIKKILEQGLSPDLIVKIKECDNQFQVKLKEIDIDLEKLHTQQEGMYYDDMKDARLLSSNNKSILGIGLSILLVFTFVVLMILYGMFELLVGNILIKDAGIFAAVIGMVGTLTGYIGANAQQVVNFYFGSNPSQAKTEANLSNSLKALQKLTPKI